MIRILLADDQDFFRQGLAMLLSREADLAVVGQATHGQEAIALTEHLQPDVVLMDVRMPICDGIIATGEIHQRWPWVRILVLTTFEDDEFVCQSLRAGALGYLLKRTPSAQVAIAIRSLHKGYSQLGPTIAPKVFSQLKPPTAEPNDLQSALSDRERQIAELIGQGKNNSEIAELLHLTKGTIKNYVTQIFDKLGVRDRVQAALWARQNLTGC
ncbi:MAG: response regulator transcription factor [Cyanobacteria bacterium J06627_8]